MRAGYQDDNRGQTAITGNDSRNTGLAPVSFTRLTAQPLITTILNRVATQTRLLERYGGLVKDATQNSITHHHV
jgi:hypothetical protein